MCIRDRVHILVKKTKLSNINVYKVPLRDVPGGVAHELKISAQHLTQITYRFTSYDTIKICRYSYCNSAAAVLGPNIVIGNQLG